jgi:hypothetical protein
VLDDPAVLLCRSRQEARYVDEIDDRDAEAIAEAHEARGLARGVRIERAGEHFRLIGDEAHRAAGDAAKPGHDVLREVALDLEEIALVGDLHDQLLDVIGFVRAVGHQPIQ